MALDSQIRTTYVTTTRVSKTPQGVTGALAGERDVQWEETFHEVCSRIPAKDKEQFLNPQNQKPFTSTQLFEDIRPHVRSYTQHRFQKFISTIDPVLSHINSFAAIISSFVQTNPGVSGLIWGSLYLVITVRKLITFRDMKGANKGTARWARTEDPGYHHRLS